MKVYFADLGLVPYGEALRLQRRLQDDVLEKGGVEGYFLLLEHPPVITVGLRGNEEHLLNPETIPVFEIERGGEVTLHAPGQLVGYLIFPLKSLQGGLPSLVKGIEEMMLKVLSHYHIVGERVHHHPGIWVKGYKIGNIGISIKRWVTMHGFSFNAGIDLELFKFIVPCGMTERKVTSLTRELNRPFLKEDMQEVKGLFIAGFEEVFGLKLVESEPLVVKF